MPSLGLGLWLGLGFKYISTILKGSEQVKVRVGGGTRYLRTEKLRSFHLRPFIVLTIAKRAHYKAERETMCSVNVLKLVSRLGLGLGISLKEVTGCNPFHIRVRVRVRATLTAPYRARTGT